MMTMTKSLTGGHQRSVRPLHISMIHVYSINYIGSKRPIITINDSEAVDDDGIYQDISLTSITPAPRERRAGKTHDVDAFFESSVAVEQNDGSVKNLRTCKKCPYVYLYSG
jgi:hypothetical protein